MNYPTRSVPCISVRQWRAASTFWKKIHRYWMHFCKAGDHVKYNCQRQRGNKRMFHVNETNWYFFDSEVRKLYISLQRLSGLKSSSQNVNLCQVSPDHQGRRCKWTRYYLSPRSTLSQESPVLSVLWNRNSEKSHKNSAENSRHQTTFQWIPD